MFIVLRYNQAKGNINTGLLLMCIMKTFLKGIVMETLIKGLEYKQVPDRIRLGLLANAM